MSPIPPRPIGCGPRYRGGSTLVSTGTHRTFPPQLGGKLGRPAKGEDSMNRARAAPEHRLAWGAALRRRVRARRPSPMRRALTIVTVLSLGATGAAAARVSASTEATVAPARPSFFISGHGWGHGVGMSQWGAYGFAQRGTSYDRILAHYYRGTALGRAPLARVRVLLGEGKKAVAVSSESPFSVRDGSGTVYELAAGPYAIGPALKVKVAADAPARALPGPLVFLPGSSFLKYGGQAYRGQVQINAGASSVQVVNNVALEPYLYGVVPREVPSAWPAEALKAQAVVARSYALAVRKSGAYDVFADTRSQVYGGVAAEKPTTNAAVDATAGQVLLFDGKVATTFFFSTSGGRTASVQDVWAGGVA